MERQIGAGQNCGHMDTRYLSAWAMLRSGCTPLPRAEEVLGI
jgi:hypothetical protein